MQSRARFNEIPKKLRKALVESGLGSTRFRRRFRRLWLRIGPGSTRLQSWPIGSTRFWKKVPEGFGGESGQVQRGSGKGFGEGSGRS